MWIYDATICKLRRVIVAVQMYKHTSLSGDLLKHSALPTMRCASGRPWQRRSARPTTVSWLCGAVSPANACKHGKRCASGVASRTTGSSVQLTSSGGRCCCGL